MLHDWIQWLCSMEFEDQVALMLPFLMLDVPRYVLMGMLVWLLHRCRAAWRWLTGVSSTPRYDYSPSVCILIVGHNEADTIQKTLTSVADVYPDLQIIVVDDGSTDGMAQMAKEFARRHTGVTVLARPERGGKSSGLNFALPFVRAEVIVCLDADSFVARDAIWELLQPMQDPNVAGVSGNLIVRNPDVSFATRLQALEYRRSIFLGADDLRPAGDPGNHLRSRLGPIARPPCGACKAGTSALGKMATWRCGCENWAIKFASRPLPTVLPKCRPPGIACSASVAVGTGPS